MDVLNCLMASLTESYTDAVVHMKNVFVQSLFFFFLLLLFSFVSPVAPVAPVSSRHVLGILRVTLKDVTGLLYLNSPKSFPQLQHLFPKTIRGTRVALKRANIHQFVTVFAELRFGDRR